LLPESIAHHLDIVGEFPERHLLADGRVVTESVGHLALQLDESLPRIITTVTGANDSAPIVIGHIALEQTGVGINPRTGELVPELTLLLRESRWPTL
jgi:hypothetical protein